VAEDGSRTRAGAGIISNRAFRTIFAQQKPIDVECISLRDRSLRSKRGNGYENRSSSHDGRIPRNVL
jgi:hypothetical protein